MSECCDGKFQWKSSTHVVNQQKHNESRVHQQKTKHEIVCNHLKSSKFNNFYENLLHFSFCFDFSFHIRFIPFSSTQKRVKFTTFLSLSTEREGAHIFLEKALISNFPCTLTGMQAKSTIFQRFICQTENFFLSSRFIVILIITFLISSFALNPIRMNCSQHTAMKQQQEKRNRWKNVGIIFFILLRKISLILGLGCEAGDYNSHNGPRPYNFTAHTEPHRVVAAHIFFYFFFSPFSSLSLFLFCGLRSRCWKITIRSEIATSVWFTHIHLHNWLPPRTFAMGISLCHKLALSQLYYYHRS